MTKIKPPFVHPSESLLSGYDEQIVAVRRSGFNNWRPPSRITCTGRNFANKIWNAFRLVKGWDVAEKDQPEENQFASEWFHSNFNKSLQELEDHFAKFRVSDALMTIYKLIWNDFCSWYLE